MKKSEFKTMIKEAVKEVILEEGFLSTIITECMKGVVAGQQLMTEERQPKQERVQEKTPPRQRKNNLNEVRKRLAESIGKDAYNGVNVFEGTTPIVESSTMRVPGAEGQAQSPMAGIAPDDPGADLSIFGRIFERTKKG